jgi:hypothetical protein
MSRELHYGTVSEAIKAFKENGFTLDFNLAENCLVCNGEKILPDDLEIVDLFRYEGNSDPADEAAVYAIQSKSNQKGILVTGYGASSDSMSEELLSKLKRS